MRRGASWADKAGNEGGELLSTTGREPPFAANVTAADRAAAEAIWEAFFILGTMRGDYDVVTISDVAAIIARHMAPERKAIRRAIEIINTEALYETPCLESIRKALEGRDD